MTKVITEFDKKKALESSLYYFTVQQPFMGSMIQELTMKYSEQVPTAGITFAKDQQQFEIYFNPEYFCSLSRDERVAVLHHEILHFTNKHLFRLPFMKASEEDRQMYNIAGDMSINQYIQNLPKGCVDVKDWKLDTGQPFPTFQSMETYYDLLKNNKKNNEEQMKGYKPFDSHDWEELDEETKQKMLEEAKKIVKRTIEKTQYGHSSVPDSIKDLLEELNTMSAALNYKQILKNAIKKSVSVSDRESTWKRPNKRYGVMSPGSKLGSLPVLQFFNDSSGSISLTEQNEYLRIMDDFLKVGSRKCVLAFWHTTLYYKKPYRRGQEFKREDIESGGTDVTCVMEDIKKSKPDLSFILTDGYFDRCNVETTSEIIWIISKGGNKDHPMKHIGKTILLEHLKD
jgi:predicted metal-dependent peptidase